MRILISNDDGVEATGLRTLAEALSPLGEVVVCAPDREQSATSHSISLGRPLRIEALPPWGPKGEIQRFSVDGTPTDAVYDWSGRTWVLLLCDADCLEASGRAARVSLSGVALQPGEP